METFLGEEFEAASLHPVAHERVGARVTFVTIRQAFLEDFAELRLQREDVPDAWRARSHPFGLLLSKFEEIEVIAAIFCFSARAKAFSETEKREKPGGSASAFCAPVSIKSIPSVSMSIFIAENDETVSTIRTTSGYFASMQQISGNGFIMPVEVSL